MSKNLYKLLADDASLITVVPEIPPDQATKKARILKNKVKQGQRALVTTLDGKNVIFIIKEVAAPRVILQNQNFGLMLTDITDFYLNPEGNPKWIVKIQPSADTETFKATAAMTEKFEELANDLNILRSEKSQTLLKRLYKEFISNTDFSKFPAFAMGLDNLFAEFRGREPIKDEEVNEFTDELDDDIEDLQVDTDEDEEDRLFVENASLIDLNRGSTKNLAESLRRHLSISASLSNYDLNVKILRNYAIANGFRPGKHVTVINLPNKTCICALKKQSVDTNAVFAIYKCNDSNKYTVAISHTRRNSDNLDNLIRPWKHDFENTEAMLEQGKAILDKYK